MFEAISAVDGRLGLIVGAPSSRYRLARYRSEGHRRDAALLNQVPEMRQRLQRRRKFVWTLPPQPGGDTA